MSPPEEKSHAERSTKDEEEDQHVHGKPYDGMCCLCTMEDITLEDGNYGTSREGKSAKGQVQPLLPL